MNPTASTLKDTYQQLRDNVYKVKETLKIEDALLEIALTPEFQTIDPEVKEFRQRLVNARDKDDHDNNEIEEREYALLKLYLSIHRLGTDYSSAESQHLTGTMGCKNQPGGLGPLILGAKFIKPHMTILDLGAGNGLQGLLLKRLSPHKLTVQAELSESLVLMGKRLQGALEMDNIKWITDDIRNVDTKGIDMCYLYRPSKPGGHGNELNETIAQKLKAQGGPTVIISVADTLRKYLNTTFNIHYQNEDMTCFVRS